MKYPEDLPKMAKVKESTNVLDFSYDPATKFLFVRFKTKHLTEDEAPLYRYADVPPGTFKRFRSAPSKGEYLWRHIRGKFRYSLWTGSTWRSQVAVRRDVAERKKLRQKND